MKVVTANEMREIDRFTIEEIGVPSPVLMERAGVAVVDHIRRLFEPKRVVVLSGRGNNGGDGLVIARELFNYGFTVKVIILSDRESMSRDSVLQYEIAKKTGIDISFKNSIDDSDIDNVIIVDAILGTGLNKPVRERLAEVIDIVNTSRGDVFAVDIPSGISADTGEVMGKAVKAKWTVTFGLPKIGHMLYPGRKYCGELFIENIGFPMKLLNSDDLKVEIPDSKDAALLIPKRPPDSHKGSYGHVLVVGGSRGKTGAPLMTARAALKSGSGLVTIGAPDSVIDVFQAKVVEEMTLSLPGTDKGGFSVKASDKILDFATNSADVIAIGPGMGVDDAGIGIMKEIIKGSPVPLIIDADGLNCISSLTDKEISDMLSNAGSSLILTPHPGEMARLIRDPFITSVDKARFESVLKFSMEKGVYIASKGAPTLIADPQGRLVFNPTGNPGMATAGSGDVLTGIIASMTGQGLTPIDASVLGCYIHGLSGDISSKVYGMHSVTAFDIVENISGAFHILTDNDSGIQTEG